MIKQSGSNRLWQAILIQTTRKITEQITNRRFHRRLCQHQVREMIHSDDRDWIKQAIADGEQELVMKDRRDMVPSLPRAIVRANLNPCEQSRNKTID